MSLLTPVGVLLPDSSVLKTHRKTLLIYVIFSLSLSPIPSLVTNLSQGTCFGQTMDSIIQELNEQI